MVDVREIARFFRGSTSGDQAFIPAKGHSARDRGVAIKADPSAPDGCLVHCFNGGDPLVEKDRLREHGFLPAREAEPVPRARITVASFDYRSADGEVIYRTVRREPADWTGPGKRPKKFQAERFEGGKWKAGLGECGRVPYRLPEMRKAIEEFDPVYLVEGEAKANKLAEMGLAATAIPFGANGWKTSYVEHFAGARVFILPDNDQPGKKFARTAFSDLLACAKPSIVELPGLPVSGDVLDWPGTAEELAKLAKNAVRPDWLDQDLEHQGSPSCTFRFVAVGDLKYRAPEFIIDELLETSALALMFGDPGCGKSFVAVDCALSVATGTPFQGRATKQGAVFFIAGEGHNGLARRFAAWSADRGVTLSDVPLFKSERSAQFLDSDSAMAVADAVSELAARHGKPALIIIDTLARNFGAGDENNTRDMSEFVAAIDNLKAHFPECAVLIIHHTGHAEKQRARGAMALKGALDCEYRVEKKGQTISLTNTKMKDAEPPPELYLNFKQIELPDGISSAVLKCVEPPEREHKLTDVQRLARDTYTAAAVKTGAWGDDGFEGLQLENWRPAFYEKHAGDNSGTKRKAFSRVRNDLINLGVLEVENDFYRWNDAAVVMEISLQRDAGRGRDNGVTCPDAKVGEGGTCGTSA